MYIVKAYSRTEQNKVTGQSEPIKTLKRAKMLRDALNRQNPVTVYKVEVI